MINLLLQLFNLNNLPLFLSTAAVSIVVFTVFYMIVYKVTSQVYCSIVGGK